MIRHCVIWELFDILPLNSPIYPHISMYKEKQKNNVFLFIHTTHFHSLWLFTFQPDVVMFCWWCTVLQVNNCLYLLISIRVYNINHWVNDDSKRRWQPSVVIKRVSSIRKYSFACWATVCSSIMKSILLAVKPV